MEHSFATMFENIRHERSLILLLSLTDSDVLRQSKVTDDEINIIKNLALENLHRQRILKEYVAASLLEEEIEYYFLFNNWLIQIQTEMQNCLKLKLKMIN